MSIVKTGSVLGFSPDEVRTLAKKFGDPAVEIGKFIPKVGVSTGDSRVAGPAPKKSGEFVDGSRTRRAVASAQAGVGARVARSRESYVAAIRNRAQPKSLPAGAVASVAQFMLNAVRAGGDSLNAAAEVYRACFLDAAAGVSQTPRGDFQDDNKGVA